MRNTYLYCNFQENIQGTFTGTHSEFQEHLKQFDYGDIQQTMKKAKIQMY